PPVAGTVPPREGAPAVVPARRTHPACGALRQHGRTAEFSTNLAWMLCLWDRTSSASFRNARPIAIVPKILLGSHLSHFCSERIGLSKYASRPVDNKRSGFLTSTAVARKVSSSRSRPSTSITVPHRDKPLPLVGSHGMVGPLVFRYNLSGPVHHDHLL